MILLDKVVVVVNYHIGSSIKDAGKTIFAISRIEDKQNIHDILFRL